MKTFLVLLSSSYVRDAQMFHGSMDQLELDIEYDEGKEEILWRDTTVDVCLGVYHASDETLARSMAAEKFGVDYEGTFAHELKD